MESPKYAVKTHAFEGPLELLLELVEKRKLFVNDVSLAEVTDDFIAYVEAHDDFPLEESAEFIVVASTLMLIKSRSLLPALPLTEEEETSIDDLGDRLRLYQRFRALAAELGKLYGRRVIFEKAPSRVAPVFSPDAKTDINHIHEALLRVIEALPQKPSIPKTTVRKIISLEETIERLAERLGKGMKASFSELYGREEKVSAIIGFLAVLELVKRGLIRVEQAHRHGEIELEREVAEQTA